MAEWISSGGVSEKARSRRCGVSGGAVEAEARSEGVSGKGGDLLLT